MIHQYRHLLLGILIDKTPRLYKYLRFGYRSIRDFRFYPKEIKHTIQIVSFGGVGTSFFAWFLKENGINVPMEQYFGQWKHQRMPPATYDDKRFKVRDGFRVIYLFGNPMNAIISVFRRNMQYGHIGAIEMDKTKWKKDWGFEDFIKQGIDVFGLDEHFTNWTMCSKDKRSYPIMLVKYETLWNHLPEIFAFTGLPYDLIPEFPVKKERDSDWTEQDPAIRHKLNEIYGYLDEKIKNAPEIMVI